MTRALQVATTGRSAKIEILDHVEDRKFIDALGVHLPFLLKLQNEWALSHRPPEDEGYVSRTADEAALKTALRAHRIVTITGVSGLCKSAIASRVANQAYAEDDYELVLWQDGRKIERVEDVRAVDVDGYGRRENLLGYLNAHKCLLVIDNLITDGLLLAILKQSSPETRILATSQADTGGGAIHRLGEVDEATARAILSRDLPACPDEIFASAYSAIGGHPLLLTILRNDVAKAGADWSRVTRLCAAPHSLIDDRRQKVCDRILEQHRGVLATEFSFISWCNSPIVDTALLAEICGLTSEENLQARQFVSTNADGTVRLNDLTLRSIRSVVPHTNSDAATFLEALTTFVERSATDRAERLVFLRIARIHRPHVRALLAEAGCGSARQRAALRLLYASSWNGRAEPSLLGDPRAEAHQLLFEPNLEGVDIRVRAIIETIEKTYWHAVFSKNGPAARQLLEALMPAFDSLKQVQQLTPELLEDIEYRQTKAWSWCERTDDAEAAFRKLLEQKPDAATHLQLGKILGARARRKSGPDADATIAAFNKIMSLPPENVATTVALDGFALLATVGHGSAVPLLTQHKDRLLHEIRIALSKGLAQPYNIVAKPTEAFWYHAGDVIDQMFTTIAGRPAPMESDHDIFAWAQAQKQYAKSRRARGAGDDEVRSLLDGAIAAYQQIETLRSRQPVQFAEALLMIGEYGPAGSAREAMGVEHALRNPPSVGAQRRSVRGADADLRGRSTGTVPA